MKGPFKRAFPASFGASFGVCLVQAIRRSWGLGDWIFNFLITFALVTAFVTLAYWLRERAAGKNK